MNTEHREPYLPPHQRGPSYKGPEQPPPPTAPATPGQEREPYVVDQNGRHVHVSTPEAG